LIGTELADPVSGALPHRSYLCRIKTADSFEPANPAR